MLNEMNCIYSKKFCSVPHIVLILFIHILETTLIQVEHGIYIGSLYYHLFKFIIIFLFP